MKAAVMLEETLGDKLDDKYVLYMKSVQDAEQEVQFMSRVYKKLRGKEARILREDFCGTGAVCCEWVKSAKDRKAYGIDLHDPTLRWGKKNNFSKLRGEELSRVRLIRGDVLDQHGFQADVVGAMNFSYFTFKQRPTLLRYARGVHKALAPDGVFALDIFGGPDAQVVDEEETEHDDFTYIWDQAAFNPVTGEIRCHIHFRMDSGKTIKKAFTYDWRLWSLPEMSDILHEAGFKTVDVYWEGTDRETGEGNGVFRKSVRGDDSACWVAYIVAAK